MDNKLVWSVLAAATIYMVTAAIFGAGIKMIATQVPAGRMEPQFEPVVCDMAVACSYPERLQSENSFDKSRLRHSLERQ